MSMKSRIKQLKACSSHLDSLGYTNQCVDEFAGVIYLLGTNGHSFHLHKLYKVRDKGNLREQNKRLELELYRYTKAFNMKDM